MNINTQNEFKAFRVYQNSDGSYTHKIETLDVNDLPSGDVLVSVHYSSLNYKDALSAVGNPGVTKSYPHTPGIDAAGIVLESNDSSIPPGAQVIVHGYDLGMNTAGGFAGLIRVPKEWVLPLPDGLSLFASMVYGTAGFTAGMCVDAVWHQAMDVKENPFVVTGATGGVGSIAVALLAHLGLEVHAVTGKTGQSDWLKSMGAAEIIARNEFEQGKEKPMLRGKWGGGVDTVGGDYLSVAIKSMQYGGRIACCGLVASPELHTTVYPFILRGVSLIGIDSVNCDRSVREKIWRLLADDWKLPGLENFARVVSLEALPGEIDKILNGQQVGRVVVDLSE